MLEARQIGSDQRRVPHHREVMEADTEERIDMVVARHRMIGMEEVRRRMTDSEEVQHKMIDMEELHHRTTDLERRHHLRMIGLVQVPQMAEIDLVEVHHPAIGSADLRQDQIAALHHRRGKIDLGRAAMAILAVVLARIDLGTLELNRVLDMDLAAMATWVQIMAHRVYFSPSFEEIC
jgi:hypothetical protein